jgi:hypothetical protein
MHRVSIIALALAVVAVAAISLWNSRTRYITRSVPWTVAEVSMDGRTMTVHHPDVCGRARVSVREKSRSVVVSVRDTEIAAKHNCPALVLGRDNILIAHLNRPLGTRRIEHAPT